MLSLVSLVCIVLRKLANLVPPYALKLAVDVFMLNTATGRVQVPAGAVLLYASAKVAAGCFNVFQDFCYAKVGSSATARFSEAMFAHLQHLSLSYHLQRRTGEVTKVMDRGITSVETITNAVIFTLFPTYVCPFILHQLLVLLGL